MVKSLDAWITASDYICNDGFDKGIAREKWQELIIEVG